VYILYNNGMTTKRDRSNERSVYISKSHHEMLKQLAETESRTIRATLELWIDYYSLHKTLPK